MLASAIKNNITNNRKRINIKYKKKLNSVLIQNDEIWVIFWHLQYKQNYNNSWDYRVQLLRLRRLLRKSYWLLFKWKCWRFRFRNFTKKQKQQKKHLFKQTEHWGLNSFTNIVAIIDINGLKI